MASGPDIRYPPGGAMERAKQSTAPLAASGAASTIPAGRVAVAAANEATASLCEFVIGQKVDVPSKSSVNGGGPGTVVRPLHTGGPHQPP